MPLPKLHIYEGTDRKSLFHTLDQEIDRFQEQNGEYNIIRMSSDFELSALEQEVETYGFLSQEKLIILSGVNLVQKSEEGEEDVKKGFAGELLAILEKTGADITIIFVYPELDSRTKLAKFLDTHAEKHIFTRDIRAMNFPPHFARIIEERTRNHESEREEILEKIDLYAISSEVNQDFIDAILPESEEAVIFTVIDAIRDGNISIARKNLMELIRRENIFGVFSSLITNIRTVLLIVTLREKKIPDTEIAGLGIHPFVIKKTRGNDETKKRLQIFLATCIESDIAQKSGKGFSDTELGIIFSIDRALLQLQKIKTRYTARTL